MIVKIKCKNCGELLIALKVMEENRKLATRFKREHIRRMNNVNCEDLHNYYNGIIENLFDNEDIE